MTSIFHADLFLAASSQWRLEVEAAGSAHPLLEETYLINRFREGAVGLSEVAMGEAGGVEEAAVEMGDGPMAGVAPARDVNIAS